MASVYLYHHCITAEMNVAEMDDPRPKNTTGKKELFPKTVYQTWISKDDSKFPHRKQMITSNPSWNFVLYDDNDIDDFFLSYSKDDEVIAKAKKAYDLIHPSLGAAKADVFRYAVVYKFGGMYLDMDSQCINLDSLLRDMESSGDDVTFLGTHSGNKELWYLMQLPRRNIVQWVFLAYQHNPILKNTIEIVLDNLLYGLDDGEIRVENMGTAVKEVTGPYTFNRGFDMARIGGYKNFKIQGIDFDQRCNFKVVGKYHEPGKNYLDRGRNDVLRVALPTENNVTKI